MSRVPLWISAGLLAAAGLALIVYKVVALGYPLLPGVESRVWTVQARFTVDSYTRPVKAVLQLPSNPPGFVILDENFVSRGFGLAVVEEEIWREAQWAIREAAGRQTFYYRAVVTPDPSVQDADTPGPVLFATLILFAFQLYGDFSGYSTIARGSARVFGIDLMENFKRPYFAKSVAEFWRRWHISLSGWLHDYVYYPVVFSLSRPSRTWIYASIVITFLISGLWHGAGWTYISMGAFFGIAIALGAITKKHRARLTKRLRLHNRPRLQATWQLPLTFALASVGWIFFRAATIEDVWTYLIRLPQGWQDFFANIKDINYLKETLFLGYQPSAYIITACCIVFLLAVEWIHEKYPKLLSPKSLFVRSFAITLVVALIIVFGEFNSKEFIYFQF